MSKIGKLGNAYSMRAWTNGWHFNDLVQCPIYRIYWIAKKILYIPPNLVHTPPERIHVSPYGKLIQEFRPIPKRKETHIRI